MAASRRSTLTGNLPNVVGSDKIPVLVDNTAKEST